jgi:hypothetical protein
MSISPGCLVTCRQCKTQLFVVKAATDNGWHITGKLTDNKGRALFTSRVAGVGDLTLIREAQTYEPGTTHERAGKLLTVLSDDGDTVTFNVPEHSSPLAGGGNVRHAGGHTTSVSKAELILEMM